MIITSTVIPVPQRASVAGQLFGIRFVYIESFVFDTAGSLSEMYTGGSWSFFTLSNGGFYMAPETPERLQVVAFNGFEGELSADAFGIAVCLSAYSMLSFNPDPVFSEVCAGQFHLLREFMLSHAEVRSILATID